MNAGVIICADVIARYGSSIVIIERLGRVPGLALPGGKQDPGETLSMTAERELFEETGLRFIVDGVLGTYAEPERDPRGHYISTVFTGVAWGELQAEPGKTRIVLMDESEIYSDEGRFVFDHFQILEEYLEFQRKR